METPQRPIKPNRPIDIDPVKNSGTSYFEDNKQYSSDIMNYILEEVNNIRFIGNKLSIECNTIQNSITELQNSVDGLTDPKLLKKIEEKVRSLGSNLMKRSKILNDYNSLSENELSVFISDKLIGNNVVDFNNSVKNKMYSLKRYTEGIIKHSGKHSGGKKTESKDLVSFKKIKKMPATPTKSKIPVPKNSYQIDEISALIKVFIMKQNLHKNKLSEAFELYNSNSGKTNA